MKKKWIVAALAAFAIALAGCKIVSEPEPIAVQSVTLNETSLTLEYGETRTLTAIVLPWNADNRYVYWSSSNPYVVWVTGDGIITASEYYEGTATITAQAGDKMATCTVTVKPPMVQNIMLNETEVWLAPGNRRILIATVTPNNAASPTWSSSNPEVAMVDDYGMITAVAEGTAIITAQVDGFKATCVVFVNKESHEQPGFPGAVESVTLNTYKLTIEPGGTRTLIATVYPYDADDKTVVWSAFNPLIATVDDDGKVTAISEGSTFITARVGDKTAECEVDVKTILVPVESVTLNVENLTLKRGETYKLTATVLPEDADDKTVAWSSTDTEVVTVNHDGTVTARSVGDATIKAQAGDKVAECVVTVNPKPIESIVLDKTTLKLACGETGKLTATVTPSDADDKTLIWSSSNTGVATVDDYVTVKALKAGTATITVTAQTGGKKATCNVTVHEHSYSGGKCTVCGANPKIFGGIIDENGVLTQYYAAKGTVIIPEGVTGIGEEAFLSGGKLTSVEIPGSVTFIGSSAFWGCGLTNVTIPDGVKSIGSKAFYNCKNLTSVTIGGGVTSFGDEVFDGCANLTEIQFKGTKAQWNAIERSDKIDITCIRCSDGHIGVEVKKIPEYLKISGRTVTGYYSEKLPTDVVIPDGVKSIGERVFNGCTGLTSVTIPSSVTEIGNYVFDGCTKLKRVNYGGTLADWCGINFLSATSNPLHYFPATTVVGDAAGLYIDDKLVSIVDIPNSVSEIKKYAFYAYYYLDRVRIPTSVISIGDEAFNNCMLLSFVNYEGSSTDWDYRMKKGSNIIPENISIQYGKYST
ncbi:MAG: leucine-rich repeat protein [Treponema sp.]|nr:leucine-rich repeat protein [Treponema sp.]